MFVQGLSDPDAPKQQHLLLFGEIMDTREVMCVNSGSTLRGTPNNCGGFQREHC